MVGYTLHHRPFHRAQTKPPAAPERHSRRGPTRNQPLDVGRNYLLLTQQREADERRGWLVAGIEVYRYDGPSAGNAL